MLVDFVGDMKKENEDMNKSYFTGRTTKDIEIRYTQGENQTALGRFSLAVETGYKDKKRTDFFNMTAWGKTAETMEKYIPKGTKIIVECEARQNNYTDRNGNKVNTVDFTVLNFEFAESKNANQGERPQPAPQTDSDGFMSIPDGIDSELPFS